MRGHAETDLRPVAVGWDPGLANLGGAVVLLGARPEDDELLELVLVLTEKSAKKRVVMAADDDFRRARELASGVEGLFARQAGGTRGVRVVCAESMSFPRNARTSAQIALAWGVLASEVERRQLPVCQAGPQEIRRRFDLLKGAAKEDVHAKLLKRYGKREVERALLRNDAYRGATEKQRLELRKHPLDALASIAASDGAEVMRSVRASA